jgi:hypothetical protein
MLEWIRLQEKFYVIKHEDNKVHCVFNGIKKILMPNLQKIFLPFTKIVMASTKSINGFYVSNMPS